MAEQEDDLLAWAAQICAGRLSSSRRLVGGNRRRAWAVDITTGSGERKELFLRFASGEGQSGADTYTLGREATAYLALADTPVKMPRIIASHPVHQALLMERVAGETTYRTIADEGEKQAIALDFIEAIHALHQVDLQSLHLPGIVTDGDLASHVRRELETWHGMYAETNRPDPLIELAFAWLRAHVPFADVRPVLVHGDAGPGNFMFDEGRLVALIDWELWHIGDPVEDIAWFSFRCVLEPVPSFAECVRAYERLSGNAVDAVRFRYHQMLVALRIVIIRHRVLDEVVPDSDLGNSLVSRLLNRRLLVETLSAAMGAPDVEPPRPPSGSTPRDIYFDYAIEQLRSVIGPQCADPVASSKTKSVARILKFLKSWNALEKAHEAQERDELAALLGRQPEDIDAGRAKLARSIVDGSIDPLKALSYVRCQSSRDTAVGSTALGVLAHRSFPPIKQ